MFFEKLRSLVSRTDPLLLRSGLTVVSCAGSAAGLAYAASRQPTLNQAHLKVASGSLLGAATATAAYEVASAYMPRRVQWYALPLLQIAKDVPGMVAVAYGSKRTVDRLYEPVVNAYPRAKFLLENAPRIVTATGAASSIVAWLNPDHLSNLDKALDRWGFSYRTLFCAPLVTLMFAAGSLALRSFIVFCDPYFAREVRARAVFASGGLFGVGCASLTYMLWPTLHWITGIDPSAARTYAIVEGMIWFGMGSCWLLALAWPYQGRSQVDRGIEESEIYNETLDYVGTVVGGNLSPDRVKIPDWNRLLLRLRHSGKLLEGELEDSGWSLSEVDRHCAETALELLALLGSVSEEEWTRLWAHLQFMHNFPSRYLNQLPKQAFAGDNTIPLEASRMVLTLADPHVPPELLPSPVYESELHNEIWARLTAVCAADLGLLPENHRITILAPGVDDLALWSLSSAKFLEEDPPL